MEVSKYVKWNDKDLAKTLLSALAEDNEVDEPSKESLGAEPDNQDEHNHKLALKIHMAKVEEEQKWPQFGQATKFVQTLMDSF